MRQSLRLATSALALFVVVAQAPEPSAAQAANRGDLVQSLAGTFACRTVEGVIVRQTGTREGDAIVVHEDVERNGKHAAYEDRYVFDTALNRWHVQTGLGGFSAGAAPPAGGRWTVQSTNADGAPVQMRLEALPGGDFRRTFAYDRGTADWFAYSVERCAPGTVPPPAGACIAANYPPATLEVAPDMGWGLGQNAPSGRVQVAVSLDEASHVTRVRVLSSTAPELNIAAMERTKRSRFRTAIVNCKPVAADYVFIVDF